MKQEHQVFITEYLATGDKYHAYKKAYPNAGGEALRSAACRLMREPEIRDRIQAANDKAMSKATEQIEKDNVKKIKAELEYIRKKRKILAEMIDGSYKVKRHIKLKDKVQEVEDDLNPYALLRAMELDTKLAKEEYELTMLKEKEEKTDKNGHTPVQKQPFWDALISGFIKFRLDEEKKQEEKLAAEHTPPTPGGTKQNNTTTPLPVNKPDNIPKAGNATAYTHKNRPTIPMPRHKS